MKTIVQKLPLLALMITAVFSAGAQDRFQLTNSDVSFFSEAPLENIEAHNKDTKGILDRKTRNFVFRVPIQSFVFQKGLMQEHFNENYMESSKFPNASFKGTFDGTYDFDKNGTYSVTATGELEIHGVKQQRTIPATIEVKEKTIKINTKFKVKLADHNIEIPTLVFNKIAEEVEVSIKSDLIKM